MSSKKIDKDILLVCTGAGNVIQGGADIWVNNFLKEADLLENMANKEKYGYSAKAGSAIVFDEGGVHKGSRPRSKDRMVLRYLYSPSNKIK